MLAAGYDVEWKQAKDLIAIAKGVPDESYERVVNSRQYLRTGDVITFRTVDGNVDHVVMVVDYDVGSGKGKFLGAQSEKTGVRDLLEFDLTKENKMKGFQPIDGVIRLRNLLTIRMTPELRWRG